MLRPVDSWFEQHDEPLHSCFAYLRKHIMALDDQITEAWRYGMPFYYYDGRRFCYLWLDKKRQWPYLGIVDGNKIDHPDLLQEKRVRMKVLLIDPVKNIQRKKVDDILKKVLLLYK